MAIMLPRCSCCGEVPAKGLYDGIWLNKGFICSNCQEDILEMDINSEEYQAVSNLIKSLIFGSPEEGQADDENSRKVW